VRQQEAHSKEEPLQFDSQAERAITHATTPCPHLHATWNCHPRCHPAAASVVPEPWRHPAPWVLEERCGGRRPRRPAQPAPPTPTQGNPFAAHSVRARTRLTHEYSRRGWSHILALESVRELGRSTVASLWLWRLARAWLCQEGSVLLDLCGVLLVLETVAFFETWPASISRDCRQVRECRGWAF
jgi:hypothetical protein